MLSAKPFAATEVLTAFLLCRMPVPLKSVCGHNINTQGFAKFRHGHGTPVSLEFYVRQNHPMGAQASVHE